MDKKEIEALARRLTDDDWSLLGVPGGRDPGGAKFANNVVRLGLMENGRFEGRGRAMLAYLDEVARGLSDAMRLALTEDRDGCVVGEDYTVEALQRRGLATGWGYPPTPLGRAVARALELNNVEGRAG